MRHFGRSIVGTIDFIAPEIYDAAQIAVELLLKQESSIQTRRSLETALPVAGTPNEGHICVISQEKYGTAVDIYAFGMVLLEMIGREQPWSECETHGSRFIAFVSYLHAASSRVAREYVCCLASQRSVFVCFHRYCAIVTVLTKDRRPIASIDFWLTHRNSYEK